MNMIKLSPCPLCGSADHIAIEHALNDEDGKFIYSQDDRHQWIVKCENCMAITELAHSKLDAIAKWNRGELTERSTRLERASYTTDISCWLKLRNEIILAQTADLEQAALEREIRRASGGRCGSELRGEAWFYSTGFKRLTGISGDVVVKGIKMKAKYDYWKYRMDCRHCAIKEGSCPHKADNSLWRQFLRGTAPGCPRREGDGTT